MRFIVTQDSLANTSTLHVKNPMDAKIDMTLWSPRTNHYVKVDAAGESLTISPHPLTPDRPDWVEGDVLWGLMG